MGRKPLNKETKWVQIRISPEDREAFEAFCLHQKITMSDRIREKIATDIAKGKKILKGRTESPDVSNL